VALNVKKFADALKARPAARHRYLYHFTETANLVSIRVHGILSLEAIEQRGDIETAHSSDSQSRRSDKQKGLHKYVHLSLYPEHPMQFAKALAGEINDTSWLKISPDIVTEPGVLFCSRLANSNDAVTKRIDQITLDDFDADIVLKYTDWNDPRIRERLEVTKKYEILIPNSVEIKYISL